MCRGAATTASAACRSASGVPMAASGPGGEGGTAMRSGILSRMGGEGGGRGMRLMHQLKREVRVWGWGGARGSGCPSFKSAPGMAIYKKSKCSHPI